MLGKNPMLPMRNRTNLLLSQKSKAMCKQLLDPLYADRYVDAPLREVQVIFVPHLSTLLTYW